MIEEIIILPELKYILPPLTIDEYKILEESLLVEGCREPLILWNGNLIDGHNRYEICKKHNIKFRTQEIESKNIDDIKIWIIDNQKGRRNLTDGWKFELARIRKDILIIQGKKTQGIRTDLLSTIDKRLEPHNTQNELAKELGWSTGKVAMADKVWSKGNENIKEKIKCGELSINEAYKELKKEENKNLKIQRERDELKQNTIQSPIIIHADCMDIYDKVPGIDLLIADPPYFTDGNYVKQVEMYLTKVKSSGQAYVFMSTDPVELLAYLNMDRHKIELSQILVWNYNNTGQKQPNKRYNSNYQICFYFRGTDAPDINKPADGKEQYACQTVNAPDARREERYFKWQKPDDLIERFIRNSSNPGDFVFDPFAGSGTTLVVASKLGRIAMGCDTNETMIRICIERGCKNA